MAKQSYYDIVNSEKPTLVDFFATWCGPCKNMEPVVRQLKSEMGDKIRILKVDIDKNNHLASKLSIRSVPTFMIYKQGRVLWQASGGQTLGKLKSELNKHI